MRAGVDGKVALVTGASRGIGLAIAHELVERGVRICLTGRKEPALQEALEELDAGDAAMAIAGNTDDPEHRADAVGQIIERLGALDFLVNNAATNPQYGPLVEADLGAVSKVLSVNLVAPLAWIQEAWRAWMAEHGGAVVNVASVGGLRVDPLIGAYNVSKAGLVHLTRQLAVELGPTVRVNAVAPAVVKTKFARALYEGREEEAAAPYPLRRLGVPTDVAPAVRFLLSEEASWITGETLVIDGGVSVAGGIR